MMIQGGGWVTIQIRCIFHLNVGTFTCIYFSPLHIMIDELGKNCKFLPINTICIHLYFIKKQAHVSAVWLTVHAEKE